MGSLFGVFNGAFAAAERNGSGAFPNDCASSTSFSEPDSNVGL
jgi:hypothetical protein